jgi:hypothetical protein
MYCPNPHCVWADITERNEHDRIVQVFCLHQGLCIQSQPINQPITAPSESPSQKPDVLPPHRDGLLGVKPRRICHATHEGEAVLQLAGMQ